MKRVKTKNWEIEIREDEDFHLNVFVKSRDGSDIDEIESLSGDGVDGNCYSLRFTTHKIEGDYKKEVS